MYYYSQCICILRCPSYPEPPILPSEALNNLGLRANVPVFALDSGKCCANGKDTAGETDCFRSVLVPWVNNCNRKNDYILTIFKQHIIQ